MAASSCIFFLTDNNVPDSIGEYLTERGHDVVRVREIMAADAADTLVAVPAMRARRVLVSWDRDFTHQRFEKARSAELSRIGMSCTEENGRARFEENIDRIEFEYARAGGAALLISDWQRQVPGSRLS